MGSATCCLVGPANPGCVSRSCTGRQGLQAAHMYESPVWAPAKVALYFCGTLVSELFLPFIP